MDATRRILIADDDENVRQAISVLLKLEGYVTEQAPEGESVIQRLLSGAPRPDLLLLDLEMPQVDGLAVLRFLQDTESLRALPVIVVTGVRAPELPAGVPYVRKPFAGRDLLAVIRAKLGDAVLEHPGGVVPMIACGERA